MNNEISKTQNWNNKAYEKSGFLAQRQYPSEEFLRFLGKYYFSRTSCEDRKKIKILEIGCGSCSNLWVMAKEGFDTFGLDISENALMLGEQMLKKWGVKAQLVNASMTKIPFEDNTFDIVADIFSTFALTYSDFLVCIKDVKRVLKKGGLFFTYCPSIDSDAFKNHSPAIKIDEWTINGIYRPSSPYYKIEHAHRFISNEKLKSIFESEGFEVLSLENTMRTYNDQSEKFSMITSVVRKL